MASASCVIALGVRIQVRCEDPNLAPAVAEIMPEGVDAGAPHDDEPTFVIAPAGDGLYHVSVTGAVLAMHVEAQVALTVLATQVRLRMATRARAHVMVRGGAVVHHGLGIVLPAPSFAGTSTLVAGLLDAGADHVSDDWAVIDAAGMLHAYPNPAGYRPVPIGLVAIARYVPGAGWAPRERSPGEGALALFANAPAARTDAPRVLPTLTLACAAARVLEGARGDASRVAPALLAAAARH